MTNTTLEHRTTLPSYSLARVKLSKEQVQNIYLEIQQRIGILQAGATEETAAQLTQISTALYRAKSGWIGPVGDEILDHNL